MVKKQLILSIATLFIFLFMFLNVSAVGTYPDVDPNMVLYYHFNNDSSVGENDTHVYDFSNENLRNGTIVAGTIVNITGGYLDGGFEFDGTTGQGVNAQNSGGELNFTEGLTVSAWIKTKTMGGEDGEIISKYLTTGNQRGWALIISNNKLQFIGSVDGINTVYSEGATTIPSNSEWIFVMGRWNGTDLVVFVNGIVDDSTPTSLLSMFNSTNGIEIGGSRRSTRPNISIDEVIVWNRSLSDSEIWNIYHDYNGCITPNENNLILGGNTNLCQGNYNINGTTSITTGAIDINSDEAILDCNGSWIYGNWTTGNSLTYQGIFTDNKNVTIKNCIVSNYGRNIRLKDNAEGTRLINSTLFTSYTSLYIGDSWNVQVVNSTFTNSSKESYGDTKYSIYGTNVTNLLVEGNLFKNTTQILIDHTDNSTIRDNEFQGGGKWVFLHLSMNNFNSTLIENNIFNESDRGIRFGENSFNGIIRNNTILNMFTDTDGYLAGIEISGNRTNASINIRNLLIENNTIKDFGCVGILLRDIEGGVIRGNTISQNYAWLLSSYPQSFGGADGPDCDNEPFMGIYLSQDYKGFVPVGTPAFINYSDTSIHKNNNITIEDNVFENINIPLRVVGTTNLTHDLTDFWFRSWQLPFFEDRNDYWISNDFDNITTLRNNAIGENIMYLGRYGSWLINYTFFRDYDYFKNINETLSQQVRLYEKTNALIFNTNGSIYGSSNIADNDGNINITLPPNNVSYVLDNYNCSEFLQNLNGNPCGREKSPIIINSISDSSTTRTWSIASNVSITGVNAYLSVPGGCARAGTVRVIPKDGSPYTATSSCSGGTLTINNVAINISQTSNQIILYYNAQINNFCQNVTSGMPNFFTGVVVIFAILAVAIIIFILFAVVKVAQGEELDFSVIENTFEMFPISVILYTFLAITILVWIMIVIFGSLCS